MRAKRCRYCRDFFTPDPRSYRPLPSGKGRRSNQTACRKPACQGRRHREADRRWRRDNPTYDDRREAAHRQWRKAHPDYSRHYRAAHPDYVQRNRQQQRRRDARRKDLANQDAIHAFYDGKIRRLIDLAKQDAIALQKKIQHNQGHEPTA